MTVAAEAGLETTPALVVDASTVVAALVDGGDLGDWAEGQLRAGFLVAPDLLPVEVTNVLRKSEQASSIGAETASLAFEALSQLTIEYSPFALVAERVWELRFHLTSYDAFYVALAELHESPLATLDKRLVAVTGPRCEFITPYF